MAMAQIWLRHITFRRRWGCCTFLLIDQDLSYDRCMDITTVSPKYQVVIPKRVREQFGLTPGQQLQVVALPGRIELVPSLAPEALRGFLQGDNTFQREPDRL